MFSIGFKVVVGSWKVEVVEAKCQQHFAATENLTMLK